MSLCSFEDLFTSTSISQVVDEGCWCCSVRAIGCGVVVVSRWIVRVSFMNKDFFVRRGFVGIHWCDPNNVMSLFNAHCIFATFAEF